MFQQPMCEDRFDLIGADGLPATHLFPDGVKAGPVDAMFDPMPVMIGITIIGHDPFLILKVVVRKGRQPIDDCQYLCHLMFGEGIRGPLIDHLLDTVDQVQQYFMIAIERFNTDIRQRDRGVKRGCFLSCSCVNSSNLVTVFWALLNNGGNDSIPTPSLMDAEGEGNRSRLNARYLQSVALFVFFVLKTMTKASMLLCWTKL